MRMRVRIEYEQGLTEVIVNHSFDFSVSYARVKSSFYRMFLFCSMSTINSLCAICSIIIIYLCNLLSLPIYILRLSFHTCVYLVQGIISSRLHFGLYCVVATFVNNLLIFVEYSWKRPLRRRFECSPVATPERASAGQ